ncbi:hypothetical protein BOX15_Mlig033294g2 [Macrostomum lignano]|nr:hypothetical protein BOX15_Mlig033294g2 [Macrostomum lignano]
MSFTCRLCLLRQPLAPPAAASMHRLLLSSLSGQPRRLLSGTPSSSEPGSGGGGVDAKPNVKVVPRIKTDIKYDGSVKSMHFITPLRAMREYVLEFSDLDKLTKYSSRSPYSHNVRIELYNRADIEALAYAKHGGKDSLDRLRERLSRQQLEERTNLFNIKKALKKLHGQSTMEQERMEEYNARLDRPSESLVQSKAGRIVLTAVAINAANAGIKAVAWWFTGSHSMLGETVHSLADTLNQIILAFGLHQSLQRPDETHPYGYAPLRNVSSLISGVGIFFCGAVVAWYEGMRGLSGAADGPHNLYWAMVIMGGSLLSEGATLIMALRHAQQEAARMNISLRQFVVAGYDPSTNVVLMEDLAAVAGVTVATVGMGLSAWTGHAYPDAAGAVVIGCLLAGVAGFIVRTNAQALIGKSVPAQQRDAMLRVMERHKVVRGVYDCKATVLGTSVRLKAEVDIDGAVLTMRYLETQQPGKLLQEIKAIETEQQALKFLMKHGENITNILGAEINEIEASIKKEFPEVKHIDLEIN